jgi:S-adenosylmethionine decarboxylase
MSTIIAPQKNPSQQAETSQPWGVSSCVDLYNCDPQLIRDEATIRLFVKELIILIDMRAYGPCHVVHFGEEEHVAGFSMFQLIETSCISGHFANASNNAYLDIFSCKAYDINLAAPWCQQFFKAQSMNVQRQERR